MGVSFWNRARLRLERFFDGIENGRFQFNDWVTLVPGILAAIIRNWRLCEVFGHVPIEGVENQCALCEDMGWNRNANKKMSFWPGE